MRYSVTTTRKAERQLLKLPYQMQLRITAGIQGLADSETWGDVRRLVNHKYDYRLRIGNYRVLFNLTATGNVAIGEISVEEIKKRDEHTY